MPMMIVRRWSRHHQHTHVFVSFFVKRWCVTLHFFFNFPNTQPPMMWNMVFITTNWKECNNHAIWIQKYNDVAPHNLHILLSCLKCWWNISFLLFLQFPAFPHTTCDITFYIIFRCFQIMFYQSCELDFRQTFLWKWSFIVLTTRMLIWLNCFESVLHK